MRLHPTPPARGAFQGSDAEFDQFLETLTRRYYTMVTMTGFYVLMNNRRAQGGTLPFVLDTPVPRLELIGDELVHEMEENIRRRATDAFLLFYGQQIVEMSDAVYQSGTTTEEQRAYACAEAVLRFVRRNERTENRF